MKRMFSILLVFLFTTVCLNAQYFQKEKIWVGPTLGYGIMSIGFGAQGEYGITENIGLGVDIGYMASTEDLGMGMPGLDAPKFEYTFLGILFSGAYHFTPEEKFDPYLKVGMGYFNIDAKLSDPKYSNMYAAAWGSGVGFGGQIGARYHFNDQWSGRAAVGYPFFFSAGVDIAFGGRKSTVKKRDIESKPAYREEEVTKDEEHETTHENPVTENVKRDGYHMYVGPYIGMNGCINTAIGNGYYPKPGFSGPDAGVSVILPFGKKTTVGAMLDIGYSKNSFTTYPTEKDDDYNTITETYTYINVQPSLYLGGFTLGVVFGFPSDLYAENQKGKEVSVIKYFSDIPSEIPGYERKEATEFLTTRVDVRLGGTIHILNDENGMLNINIHAAYNLSGLYQHAEDYEYAYEKDPDSGTTVTEAKSKLNATPVSLTFGISYLFNIGF